MPQTLAERVDELEKRVAELTAALKIKPTTKDWLSTVGTWQQDELSREADRLGREYREAQRDQADAGNT